MLFIIAILMVVVGALFMFVDVLIPLTVPVGSYQELATLLMSTLPLQLMGLVLFIIGMIIIYYRAHPFSVFFDLPNSKIVPLIHSRNSDLDPDACILKGTRMDLELIRAKNKVFKDAGGSFRLMGHGCRRTYENIAFTVPDWLSSFFHKVKENYNVGNSDEFHMLRDALKGLRQPGSYLNELGVVEKIPCIEEQLGKIKLLEPVLNDPDKRSYLLGLPFRGLQQLEYMLYDGVTHNGDGVSLFIDSATPNDIDVLEHQTFLNDRDREKIYSDTTNVDWGKIGPWMVMLILIGVVAAIMLKGAFG